MKTTLIFAMSINGFIAESDNSVHWSDDIWKAYQEVSWKVWNMIVGRKTYELMIQSGEIETLGLRNLVIISKQSDITTHHVEHTPEDALKYLVSIGETEVIICGGTSIATYSYLRVNSDVLSFEESSKFTTSRHKETLREYCKNPLYYIIKIYENCSLHR